MINELTKDTIKTLLRRPKLIRLAFLTSYSYTLYQIYWVVFFINGIINLKNDQWVDISDALVYFVNSIQKFNILWLIITIIALFILWIWIFGPIWRQALVYSIDNEKLWWWSAFVKWRKKRWVMTEFWWVNMRWLSMWSVFIFLVRFWMLWYLDNIIVKIVFWIWIFCVILKTILWPYVDYFIVLKNTSAWDWAMKSMNLAISHPWITIKWLLNQTIIRCTYFLKIAVLIWVPVLIIAWAVQLKLIDFWIVEILCRILIFIALVIFIYLEAIYKAFDNVYRYNIFLEIENLDKK